jgi:hypothetical protein
MLDDCAVKLGGGWLLLGFLSFLGFTLLSFSHDPSPCSVNMMKYAATNVMRLKQVTAAGQPGYGKAQRAQMIICHGKM